ncbi:adenylate/guanylate cyclase domain-containing protein [Clostridium sp. M14]|uniref:adenylate/guanylate cyclase domain-containing protein n=1 Tax=Clostridium sp. M14 TaxID=2716311 RepID=UPI0013EE70D0|nr:adenylate/guanylate cyclase domain-containing protein [Clostridium sp. M14]MBZ9691849.1 adenylate cyclase [Clostridium sp. M14]
MANYDYKAGKKRIKDILDNKLEVIEKNKVPLDDEFTFNNGYYSWVTGLFVDIRDSSSLFSDEDKEKVSKIIRCFTSEIIEILRDNDNLREIGIRGDCVYAIYTTPGKDDEYEIADMSFYINTYMKMLNKLLADKKFPTVSVGIGVATAQELVVKAGRKDVGINNKVWIGDAVTKASNLSSLGNKNGLKPIVFSSSSYNNFINQLVENNGDDAKGWFTEHTNTEYGTYYDADIIKSDFNDWINNGMKE